MHYVYIMTTKRALKIGVSKNPEKRIKSLQTANPDKITLAHVEPMNSRTQAYNIEKRMLHSYKKYKSNGEWFKNLSVVKAVKTLKATKEWHDKYSHGSRIKLMQNLESQIGLDAITDFVIKANTITPCGFVIEKIRNDEDDKPIYSSCLIAVTRPKYDKETRKNNIKNVKHIGHINSNGSVFREYDNWSTKDRTLIYLEEDMLLNPNTYKTQ